MKLSWARLPDKWYESKLSEWESKREMLLQLHAEKQPNNIDEDIIKKVKDGFAILAIRDYRERYNVSLNEAQKAIRIVQGKPPGLSYPPPLILVLQVYDENDKTYHWASFPYGECCVIDAYDHRGKWVGCRIYNSVDAAKNDNNGDLIWSEFVEFDYHSIESRILKWIEQSGGIPSGVEQANALDA